MQFDKMKSLEYNGSRHKAAYRSNNLYLIRFMNLLGTIVEHQNSLLRLYRKLEERFEENGVIQSFWHGMAGDVSSQIQSLKSLPSSLWNQFKNDADNSFESAVKTVKDVSTPPADIANISLRDCFEISLQMAEPAILKIYARVIRMLRKNPTMPALNFYILLKAHVTRLVRTTESFAGDPLLIRRAQLLLAGMEKEVREPALEIKTPALARTVLQSKAPKIPVSDKADTKAAKKTTKAPPENVKAATSKPAKTATVKTGTLPEKTPATTKRARR